MKRLREATVVPAAIAMAVAVCAFDASPLHAQADRKLKFSTVAVNQREGLPLSEFTLTERRFTSTAAPLIKLIEYAYDTSVPAIEGKVPVEPFWDIDATSTVSATPGQMREMLKNLLAERFALRTHVQARRMSVFRLVLEPGGHKLRPATAQGVANGRGGRLAAGQFEVYSRDGWHVAAASVSVREIARWFADSLKTPVIDATGLRGTFDLSLNPPVADSATLYSVVAHELGLKLEPATAAVDVLVIDGFKMP